MCLFIGIMMIAISFELLASGDWVMGSGVLGFAMFILAFVARNIIVTLSAKQKSLKDSCLSCKKF